MLCIHYIQGDTLIREKKYGGFLTPKEEKVLLKNFETCVVSELEELKVKAASSQMRSYLDKQRHKQYRFSKSKWK